MEVATMMAVSSAGVMLAESSALRAAWVARSEVAWWVAAQRRWRMAVLAVIQASSTPAGAPTSSLVTIRSGT